MKPRILSVAMAILLALVLGCSSGTQTSMATSNPGSSQRPGQGPFLVSVVPSWSGGEPYSGFIDMGKESPHAPYVILTNISKEPQAVFETWNGWGYQAVSFAVRTHDGRTFALSVKAHGFRANAPTTFLVPPGEHVVYPIKLDETWESVPELPTADVQISLKAIYEIQPTPEGTKARVWAGHAESKSYEFTLRHS